MAPHEARRALVRACQAGWYRGSCALVPRGTGAFLFPGGESEMRAMTELLYQTDSYLREFSAQVVAVDAAGNRVALDRTAFYPGGGGQPHDTGLR